MIVRDLVARISFKADPSSLKNIEEMVQSGMSKIKQAIVGVVAGEMGKTAIEAERLKIAVALSGDAYSKAAEYAAKLAGQTVSTEQINSAIAYGSSVGLAADEIKDLADKTADLLPRTTDTFDVLFKKFAEAYQHGNVADFINQILGTQADVASVMRLKGDMWRKAGGEVGDITGRAFNRNFTTSLWNDPEMKAAFKKGREMYEGSTAYRLEQSEAAIKDLWTQVSETVAYLVKDLLPLFVTTLHTIIDLLKQVDDWWLKITSSVEGFRGALEKIPVLGSILKGMTTNAKAGQASGNLDVFSTPTTDAFGNKFSRGDPVDNLVGAVFPNGLSPLQDAKDVGQAAGRAMDWANKPLYAPPSITIGDVHIHTQATDVNGIAQGAVAELERHLRQAMYDIMPSMPGANH